MYLQGRERDDDDARADDGYELEDPREHRQREHRVVTEHPEDDQRDEESADGDRGLEDVDGIQDGLGTPVEREGDVVVLRRGRTEQRRPDTLRAQQQRAHDQREQESLQGDRRECPGQRHGQVLKDGPTARDEGPDFDRTSELPDRKRERVGQVAEKREHALAAEIEDTHRGSDEQHAGEKGRQRAGRHGDSRSESAAGQEQAERVQDVRDGDGEKDGREHVQEDIRRRRRECSERPHDFEAWGELLVDGLQTWVVFLVYMLVPLVVAAVTVGGAFVSMAAGGNVGMSLGGMMIGLALTGLLALAFGYFAAAGIVNFAREGRFGAAFDVDFLREVTPERDYAVAWLVSVVVVFVAGFAAAVPLVGWILAPLASFYALVVAANLWADGVSAALAGLEAAGGPSREESVA